MALQSRDQKPYFQKFQFKRKFLQISWQFEAPKIVFKSPRLIGQKSLSYGHLINEKIGGHIFETANFSGFATWEFTAKEDLNPLKQVFLLNLRVWPAQKWKIWSIFYGKKFI